MTIAAQDARRRPWPPEPPADAPPLDHFRHQLHAYGPELAARWEAFAARLASNEVRELMELVARTDDGVAHRAMRDEEADWLAVFRHLGMLPAAKVLHAHVLGMYIHCEAGDCEGYEPDPPATASPGEDVYSPRGTEQAACPYCGYTCDAPDPGPEYPDLLALEFEARCLGCQRTWHERRTVGEYRRVWTPAAGSTP